MNSNSPLNPYLKSISEWVSAGCSNTQIVNKLRELGISTSEASIRRARKRAEITGPDASAQPSFKTDGNTAVISSGVYTSPPSAEELILTYGLDPEDWTWDNPEISISGKLENPNYRIKLKLKRKVQPQFVVPARTEGYRPPTIIHKPDKKKPKLWVLPGDQQAPKHSLAFHESYLKFTDDVKPDFGVLMGDGIDFPSLSTHRPNPEWDSTAQEGLDSYHEILCDYRTASPGTAYQMLLGNHEDRLRRYILDRAPKVFGLRPANSDYPSIFSMQNLLRLDELNIKLVEPNGEYTHAQVEIAPDLIARHGWLTGPNAMSKALSGLTCSIVYGHVHSEATKAGTRWSPQGAPTHIQAFENGTMSELKGGQGFAVDVNWSPCFSTVEVWDDGTWHHEFARFRHGKLYWRGNRY